MGQSIENKIVASLRGSMWARMLRVFFIGIGFAISFGIYIFVLGLCLLCKALENADLLPPY